MVISCLLLLFFACHSICAADLSLRIQAPDAALMMPPVNPPLLRKEGLPLSWENASVEEFIGYIEKGAYKEALTYFREQEGSGEGGSFLDMIEEGDSDGRLKRKAATGGTEQGEAAGSFLQDFNKRGRISAYMLYLIGHTYFALEKYPAAETAFLAALLPMPDYTRVHESLGFLYLRTGRYEDAQKHLTRIAGLGLHTAELHGALAYLHYQTGNYWGAADAFRKALMLNPDNKRWERGLLQALSRTYQYQNTLVLVKRMLVDQPDDAGLWLFRAKAALRAGEREEALSSLETAIRLGDDNRSNLEACAILHMERGSIERATELMKGGLAGGMNFGSIDLGMSRLMQAGEWDSLKQMLGAVRDGWDDLDGSQRSRVLAREADISLHLNDKTAAGNALKKAIAMDPSNAYALLSWPIYIGERATIIVLNCCINVPR